MIDMFLRKPTAAAPTSPLVAILGLGSSSKGGPLPRVHQGWPPMDSSRSANETSLNRVFIANDGEPIATPGSILGRHHGCLETTARRFPAWQAHFEPHWCVLIPVAHRLLWLGIVRITSEPATSVFRQSHSQIQQTSVVR